MRVQESSSLETHDRHPFSRNGLAFAAPAEEAPLRSDGAEAPPPDKDENGSGTGVLSVGRSFDQRIDGLLIGVRWNGSITYSDPDSTLDYQAGYPEALSNFSRISADQLRVAQATLDATTFTQPAGHSGLSVEGFTNLGITYAGAGSGAGTIRLANTSDPGTAYAYYPNAGVTGGDAFFGGSGRFPTAGNYDYHTVIHELGHSLGLKHGQEATVYGALPFEYDSMEFSVMTYRSYVGAPLTGYQNEASGYAQTFMMLDIAALQYMYGADFTTNAGNTTYSWNPLSGATMINGAAAIQPGGNRIFMTVWDGGGVDTYNLSNYSTNLSIDLAPGGYSTFSTAQLADLNGFSAGGLARGNVFNALQYNGDLRSLIENAIGGSGNDSIWGNQANNALTGNGGNDTMNGLLGNDTLNGGAGDDTLDGWEGNDVANGGDGNDTIWGFSGDDVLDGVAGNDSVLGESGNDIVMGGGGNDTLDGGDGLDLLRGWSGRDILIGGTNFDVFDFDQASHSAVAAPDVIRAGSGAVAFENPGLTFGDIIDLRDMDANTTAAGNQIFLFGGTGKGRIRLVNESGNTAVLGNVDNDSTAEFKLLIEDGARLASAYTADDFYL